MSLAAAERLRRATPSSTYPSMYFFSRGKLLLTREGVVEPAEVSALTSDHLLK